MKKLLFLPLIFISSLIAQEYIDVVSLNNGDVIKGKIIENIINEHIRIELKDGTKLKYIYTQIKSIEVEKISKRSFGNGFKASKSLDNILPFQDCYRDGYQSGQSISSSGQMIGGFIGGFTLGFIGWGISYAIVSSGSPKPPYQETQSLDKNCKLDYENGYTEGALKVKKSSVNIGGIIGTLAIINLFASSY
jgi:hypothetical protein